MSDLFEIQERNFSFERRLLTAENNIKVLDKSLKDTAELDGPNKVYSSSDRALSIQNACGKSYRVLAMT